MSETIIAALVGSVMTLTATIVTSFTNSLLKKRKWQLEIQQKKYEIKREKLNDIYEKLVDIVNQYPNSSPNDALLFVEYPPNYSMESFDTVLNILDYQIEDYKKQLNIENINYKRKSDIDTQISNREYAKKRYPRFEMNIMRPEIDINYFVNSIKQYLIFMLARMCEIAL